MDLRVGYKNNKFVYIHKHAQFYHKFLTNTDILVYYQVYKYTLKEMNMKILANTGIFGNKMSNFALSYFTRHWSMKIFSDMQFKCDNNNLLNKCYQISLERNSAFTITSVTKMVYIMQQLE